jgi:hypothetical protein
VQLCSRSPKKSTSTSSRIGVVSSDTNAPRSATSLRAATPISAPDRSARRTSARAVSQKNSCREIHNQVANVQMLSDDDVDIRHLTPEELDRAWDLWFDLAQTTNENDPPYSPRRLCRYRLEKTTGGLSGRASHLHVIVSTTVDRRLGPVRDNSSASVERLSAGRFSVSCDSSSAQRHWISTTWAGERGSIGRRGLHFCLLAYAPRSSQLGQEPLTLHDDLARLSGSWSSELCARAVLAAAVHGR